MHPGKLLVTKVLPVQLPHNHALSLLIVLQQLLSVLQIGLSNEVRLLHNTDVERTEGVDVLLSILLFSPQTKALKPATDVQLSGEGHDCLSVCSLLLNLRLGVGRVPCMTILIFHAPVICAITPVCGGYGSLCGLDVAGRLEHRGGFYVRLQALRAQCPPAWE